MRRSARRMIARGLFGALAMGLPGSASAVAPSDANATCDDIPVSAAMSRIDHETPTSDIDLLALPPVDEQGHIRAIIEIPAGTTEKWEIDKASPRIIRWERNATGLRTIAYLGYPANYGVIPGTLAAREQGGDGDPLDVLVLGPMLPRGSIVAITVIGVLNMTDNGEADDKLIAVPVTGSPLSSVRSIAQLDTDFPGVTGIIASWFANYKGKAGRIALNGFGGAESAADAIAAATLPAQ